MVQIRTKRKERKASGYGGDSNQKKKGEESFESGGALNKKNKGQLVS